MSKSCVVSCWHGEVQETAAYLAAFICEDELDGVVCVPRDRDDLAGYPAEFLVREPDLRALAVYVFRHGGCKSEVDFPTSPILPICPLAESGTRHVARCYIPVGANDRCPEHTQLYGTQALQPPDQRPTFGNTLVLALATRCTENLSHDVSLEQSLHLRVQ